MLPRVSAGSPMRRMKAHVVLPCDLFFGIVLDTISIALHVPIEQSLREIRKKLSFSVAKTL